MPIKKVWLSYDLSIDGDYENFYAWLDNLKAKECGDSVAVFDYEYNNNIENELLEDLQKAVRLKNNDRIYLIYIDETGRIKGKFIFGKRKKAPWEGYGDLEEDLEDY